MRNMENGIVKGIGESVNRVMGVVRKEIDQNARILIAGSNLSRNGVWVEKETIDTEKMLENEEDEELESVIVKGENLDMSKVWVRKGIPNMGRTSDARSMKDSTKGENENMDGMSENRKKSAIDFFEQLARQGIDISEKQKKKMNHRLSEILNYEPTIGIFGKTGAGKSSLCNALFGKEICQISDVEACTREKQEVVLNIGDSGIKLWDVPGVGENAERDKEYSELYEKLLPKIDLVLWIVKADDRALASDEDFYKRILKKYVDEGKPFFIVLNQVDKIEPFREWNEEGHKPGTTQFENICRKIDDVAEVFDVATSKVIPVSANEKYNLTVLVDEFIRALPLKKKAVVFNAVKEEHQSPETKKQVQDATLQFIFGLAGVVVGAVKEIIIAKINTPVAPTEVPSNFLGKLKEIFGR